MIKLQIIGHIGKDCLMKEVNGRNVINFSVAHTEKYKNREGVSMESTTWVECSYWTDKTAIAQYLTKGVQVYAEGKPSADAFTTNNNEAKATLRMNVTSIQLLGGQRNDNNNNNNSAPAANSSNVTAPASNSANGSPVVNNNISAGNDFLGSGTDDDLPF